MNQYFKTFIIVLLLLLLLSHLSGVRLCVAAATAKLLQLCLTVQSHRRQPTRLPRPWDSPGKNTGMGCHFLLQCMKGKSEVTQSCPTLHDPVDCSLPGAFVHGISQARVLEWGAIAFSVHKGRIVFILFTTVCLVSNRLKHWL